MAAPTHIPMDITTEILSRLPVESLMRFKCVSKSFYNLISNDPFFRKKHLYHQSSFKKVILFPSDYISIEGNIVYRCPLLSLSPEGDVREGLIDIEPPGREGDSLYTVNFHNSCNGLFCMSTPGGDAVIWNPTTRQARRFQGCRLGDPSWIGYYVTWNSTTGEMTTFQGYPSWIGYSLAHDSCSDIYKLLALCIYGRNTYRSYRLYFYSTEMETWRYIEDSSCAHACDYVKYDGKPTIVNGAFHWLGSSEKDFRMPHVVVSLDISDETYGSLALPQAIFDDNSRGPTLHELKGKLCIFSEHSSSFCCDLWVMNEYGAADSMIRMFHISCVDLGGIFWPIHMLENDTLVIYSSGQIYFYKDGRVLPNTKDPYAYLKMDPYVYFESLISPHTCLLGKAYKHHMIVPNGFSATMRRGKHSSYTVQENAFSSEIVANNFSPITSRGKHVAEKRWQKSEIVANNFSSITSRGKHVIEKRWQKSCLQRLCFCKSF